MNPVAKQTLAGVTAAAGAVIVGASGAPLLVAAAVGGGFWVAAQFLLPAKKEEPLLLSPGISKEQIDEFVQKVEARLGEIDGHLSEVKSIQFREKVEALKKAARDITAHLRRDPTHLMSLVGMCGDLEDVVNVVDTYAGLEGSPVRTREMLDGMNVAETTIVDLADALRGRLAKMHSGDVQNLRVTALTARRMTEDLTRKFREERVDTPAALPAPQPKKKGWF